MEAMKTRYMERPPRGKRALDSTSAEDGQPERKRPALASVIVEALKVDCLQKLCSSLEPILRRVVSEEVERTLAKLGPAKLSGRSSPKRIEGPDGRNLQLQFRSRLSLPLFTGNKVVGEQGAAIHIVLIDATTGHVVTSGQESSARLEIVVLEGGFSKEDDDVWSREDFNGHLVKEREGNRPLLTGDLQVTLKDGVGTLGELTFTDNSSWVRSRKFRLGLKVASGSCEGVQIREAKTEAFTVRDHRGESYKKHYPPALNDEVWRLVKIGKDGAFHKSLNKSRILTVEDFLRFVVRDTQRLRNILGRGMSNKMWDALVEHAKTCVLNGKLYVYYPDDDRSVGVVFNTIHELSGLIANGQFNSAESLAETQKVNVDSLVKQAYDNGMHFSEYDGKTILGSEPVKSSHDAQIDVPVAAQDYSNRYEHQFGLLALPVPVHTEQPSLNSGLAGYDNGRVSVLSQNANLNAQHQFDSSSIGLQNHMPGTSSQLDQQHAPLALVPPPESSTSVYHQHQNNMSASNIASFSMEGNGYGLPNVAENWFYPSPSGGGCMSNTSLHRNFEDDRGRSGKAVVGWLKLTAALRWGIFIRKRAAERRAQLVDDFLNQIVINSY